LAVAELRHEVPAQSFQPGVRGGAGQVRSRGPEGRCGHDGLEFDGGQSAEQGLSAASLLGPLDPGHDRDPSFLTGGPGTAVEDVLLQQTEEGLGYSDILPTRPTGQASSDATRSCIRPDHQPR
jgi:hypothetical protein